MTENLVQKLMDEAYDRWKDNNDWSKQDFRKYISENMSREHLIAVQVGNLNYQVENGGFLQWFDNGYSTDLEDLILYCEEIGTETATKIKTILKDVRDIIDFCCNKSMLAIELLSENMLDEYAEMLNSCLQDYMSDHLDRCDNQYYVVNEEFLSDVETYLTKTQEEGGK